ncbi:MAG: carboxypeptidase-like regulatory domain-containing protein [Pirellulales bacterium]
MLAVTATWLPGLAGCGPSSDRLEVSGTVKLNGAPLDEGAIRLTSVGTEKLFASGAMIENGQFTVPQEKGLPPGTYAVEISSPDTKATPVRPKVGPGEPALPPMAPERIPAEYNSKSKHMIEVSADSENHFEFDIQGRAAS